MQLGQYFGRSRDLQCVDDVDTHTTSLSEDRLNLQAATALPSRDAGGIRFGGDQPAAYPKSSPGRANFPAPAIPSTAAIDLTQDDDGDDLPFNTRAISAALARPDAGSKKGTSANFWQKGSSGACHDDDLIMPEEPADDQVRYVGQLPGPATGGAFGRHGNSSATKRKPRELVVEGDEVAFSGEESSFACGTEQNPMGGEAHTKKALRQGLSASASASAPPSFHAGAGHSAISASSSAAAASSSGFSGAALSSFGNGDGAYIDLCDDKDDDGRGDSLAEVLAAEGGIAEQRRLLAAIKPAASLVSRGSGLGSIGSAGGARKAAPSSASSWASSYVAAASGLVRGLGSSSGSGSLPVSSSSSGGRAGSGSGDVEDNAATLAALAAEFGDGGGLEAQRQLMASLELVSRLSGGAEIQRSLLDQSAVRGAPRGASGGSSASGAALSSSSSAQAPDPRPDQYGFVQKPFKKVGPAWFYAISADEAHRLAGSGDPLAEHFFEANRQCARQPVAGYRVSLVVYCHNPAMIAQYEEAARILARRGLPTAEHYVFHVTSNDKIPTGIQLKGFRIGGLSYRDDRGAMVLHPVRHGTAMGYGVYTAAHAMTSMSYAAGCSQTMLLLCKVLPGFGSARPLTRQQVSLGLETARDGAYQSHGSADSVLVLSSTALILPLYIVFFAPHLGLANYNRQY